VEDGLLALSINSTTNDKEERTIAPATDLSIGI
jgi:hypothetical protein